MGGAQYDIQGSGGETTPMSSAIVEWHCACCDRVLDPQFRALDPGAACSVCGRVVCSRCLDTRWLSAPRERICRDRTGQQQGEAAPDAERRPWWKRWLRR